MVGGVVAADGGERAQGEDDVAEGAELDDEDAAHAGGWGAVGGDRGGVGLGVGRGRHWSRISGGVRRGNRDGLVGPRVARIFYEVAKLRCSVS